jgi:hypothetical protein
MGALDRAVLARDAAIVARRHHAVMGAQLLIAPGEVLLGITSMKGSWRRSSFRLSRLEITEPAVRCNADGLLEAGPISENSKSQQDRNYERSCGSWRVVAFVSRTASVRRHHSLYIGGVIDFTDRSPPKRSASRSSTSHSANKSVVRKAALSAAICRNSSTGSISVHALAIV